MGKGVTGIMWQVKTIAMHNRDGSGLTQTSRLQNLRDFVKTVYEKYKIQKIASLKQKHVNHFVEKLKSRDISPHAMRIKMSAVRWLAQKIGKPEIVEKTNAAYGLPDDPRVQTKNQAWPDEKFKEVLDKVKDPRAEVLMHGARHAGLRLEEASLLRGKDIDLKNHLVHLHRGTKGGRYRFVPLTTPSARAWAKEHSQAITKHDGIIPKNMKLSSWKTHVARQLRNAGAGRAEGLRFHGLRHSYAQEVYRTTAGVEKTPIEGGKVDPKKHKDACYLVSKRVGHNRWSIAEQYVGHN